MRAGLWNSISVAEASRESGYARSTLERFCRDRKFFATKPMGNRHGWRIDAGTFREFLRKQELSRTNNALYGGAGK